MSILSAIKEAKHDNNNLQDLALLPQALIMQMAQRGEIQKELVPLIIGKKAEMIEAMARNQALANSGQTPPTVMEQKMMEIAQAENPAPEPQMQPQQMAMPQGMAQLPEDVGIASNPVPPMQMAGGGIIAFAPGGDVDEDDDDDESYEDYLDELQRARLESMIRNVYQDDGMSAGVGTSYIEAMPKRAVEEIKVSKKEKDKDGMEDLMAYVLKKESGGRRYDKEGNLLTSPKGALGEMEVMPMTIQDPGFGVTPARNRSPDEIARVGRDYLGAMMNRYGDPKLAAIAYNMGPGATDKWLASGADVRKLPAETRGYIAGLAKGGAVKHYVRGDLVMDDFGFSYGADPRTQSTFDEYNRTVAELEEEYKKQQKGKPLTKEAERYIKEKAARDAKVKIATPKATVPGVGGLRGATIPSLGLASATAAYEGLSGPDQVNIPTAADVNPGDLTAEEIAAAKRPALIYPRIRGKERYTSELPVTRDQKPRPITPNPLTTAPTAAAAAPTTASTAPQNAEARPLVEAPYQDVDPNAVTTAPMSATDKLFAQMQEALSKREARLEAARKQDPWLAGLAAGLGMLGSTSPYAMVNIGQGGGQGVAQYSASQRARAAEEAGIGALQNKMLSTAMTGELRKELQEQAKAGKESKLAQDLQIAKNNFIKDRLGKVGIDELMLGNLKRKQALGKLSADEVKLLDYYEKQRKSIETEADRLYAPSKSGGNVIRLS
jgi:hypothetical protein